MNIYKVETIFNVSYDEYDSFVCIAVSEQEAREMHPDGPTKRNPEYKRALSTWVDFAQINSLKVTLIGVANDNQNKGIVLSSFNAG